MRISAELSVTLLHDPAGEVLGVAAIMRDVIKGWNREKQVRQRLADLEAQVGAK
jgi:hypothetical protein